MSEQLLSMNLQFFGEEGDTGAEVSEIAEPIDSTVDSAEVVDGSEVESEGETIEQESTEPVFDQNAIAAAARREAEAKLKERDAEIVRRFGHLKNPITGKAIESEKDYFEALDAQETLKRNRELEEKGIDPTIIDQAIANNPIVRQAEQVMAEAQQAKLNADIENQIKMINSFDPTIKSVNDLENSPHKEEMIGMVQKGYSLYDAYRLANLEEVMGKKSAAAKQAAINQAKGKDHLTPTTSGSSANDGMMDIPEKEMSKWRAFFPDASAKELREKYNKAHRNKE